MRSGNFKKNKVSVRNFFFLLLLLVLLSSCLGRRGLEVDFSDGRLAQGGLALLHLSVPRSDEPIATAFKGGRAVVLRTENGGAWAIVAADLETEPGRYYITFRQGRNEISTSVRIVSGEFSTSRIRLPKGMVEFDKKTLARIEREKKELSAVFATSAKKRLWRKPFIMPLKGRISGEFGERRILNGNPRSPHGGLDIAAPAGTPVRAAAAGRVAFTGKFFFYGNFVVIDHGLGVFTLYAHLDSILVKKGEPVTGGQTVGLVGSTGRATGPHLHFAVTIGGVRISPDEFIAVTARLMRLVSGKKT
jgi:murein DD-endopeptidase MepM/ murein hydrolase activator NlpD